MRTFVVTCLLGGMILGSSQLSRAGYVGDPIAMDAPYDLSYYEDESYSSSSPGISLNPSQFGYEFMGPMSFHQGGGRAKIHNAYLYAHLIPQEKDAKFSMGLDMIYRMTWFTASNSEIFKSERLYTLGLNASGTYSFSDSTKFFFGLSGLLSTDFDTVTHNCVQIGARGGISHRFNDRFSLQLGVYYSPQLTAAPLLPIIGFRYNASDDWYIQLDPMRFRVINTVNESFSWGPFVGMTAGSWNIKRDRRDTRFSYVAGICGVQANISLGSWGNYTPVLTTEIGCTFASNYQYRNSSGRHKLESVNADPGTYVQAGIKIEF